MDDTSDVTISVLGPLSIAVGGRPVPVGGPKPLTVVAVLTMEANRVVSDDRLIEAVWPSGTPLSAAKTLYTMVSRLRSAVGSELRIERVEDGYRLVIDPSATDVGRVEELARRAQGRRDQDPQGALALYAEALAMWRGRPYGQFESADFAVREVARLNGLRLALVEQRVGVLIDLDPAAAVAELEALVLEHPLQERLWGQLMRALYRSGRSSDALGAFQRARTGLATELGLEPGADLQRLQHSILTRSPDLDAAPTTTPDAVPAAAVVLPSGPGVLLFAEVAGWTERFADPAPDDREWLRTLWEQFDRLVAEHGGTVFGHRAHQRRAVFPVDGSAIAAAWAAAAMTGSDGDGGPVLRIAVHADELLEVAGDYLGSPIRRTEHLLGEARAGVIASYTALPLSGLLAAEQWVPAAAGESRGPFFLGDPDRVRTLIEERTPAPRRPDDLVSFVGRDVEQREIADLWRRSRLVTLAGIGGIGKTRLALRIAATEQLISGQRSVAVELAPVREGALVLREVGIAVGAADAPDEGLVSAIAEQIGDEPLDLVLDNCEHLQAASARVAERLLRTVPRLRILATTREPLKIPGEVIFRLPPLDTAPAPGREATELADASRLFVDRARDSSPGLTLTSPDVANVQAICERLDGIPLAIELVAARVRHLAIGDLAERIDSRMALLIKGESTRPARHQTLGAAIDWSYDLLEPDSATLFAELSVFTGGWTLAAADAVGIASGERTADLLADLVDKSLVVADLREGRMRYRMLETVRVYAGERLTAEPTAHAAREAHARWFTEFVKKAATEIEGADLARAVEHLDIEHANIRAALHWAFDTRQLELAAELAAALAPYWTARGLLAEGAGWLDRLIAVGDGLSRPLRVAVLEARAEVAMNVDSFSAPAILDEALVLSREVGDAGVTARILASSGLQRRLIGDIATAEQQYAEALALYRSIGDLAGIAQATGRIGDLAFVACDGERALAHLGEAARLQQQLDLPKALSWTLGGIGLVEAALGNTDRAEGIAAESLRMFQDINDTVGIAWAMCALGQIALNADRPEAAEGHYTDALRTLVTIGEGKDTAWALEGIGLARLAAGDLDAARHHFFDSLDLAVEANQVGRIATLLGFFGLTQVADEDWETAARCLLHARQMRERAGRRAWPADTARFEAALAATRAALGKETFASLSGEVSGTTEHAVAIALRSLPRRSGGLPSRKAPPR